MIQANNVTVQFGGRALFERVNVTFSKGNCYGIIGANGAGKSTFLKVLDGELEPQKGEVVITPGERLSVLKQDHFAYDQYQVVRTVLMGNPRLIEIMEEKDALYAKPDFSEADGVRAGELEAEFADMDGWNAESDAEFMLNKLGVTDEYHYMTMAELPANLKVKVLLAQALFGNPDILLLDEPTNHLDLSAIRWLENFLLDFENTVIVVSHDRHFLNKVCTHICDVDFGKIQMYVGNYDFWYEYTQMRQRQARDQNKKNEQKIKELQAFIARFSANAAKSKQATSRKKQLDALEMIDMPVSSRRFPFVDFKPDRECGNDLLRVDHLTKTIGDRKVLDDISFAVKPGEVIVVVGPSGCGKSTLLRCLNGLEPTQSGRVRLGNETVAYGGKNLTQLRQRIGMVFQSYELFPHMTVLDNVLLAPTKVQKRPKAEVQQEAEALLDRVGLLAKKNSYPRELSGGQKQRVAIVRALCMHPEILLFDEVTAALDPEMVREVLDVMLDLAKQGKTMIIVTHEMQFARAIANRVIFLDGGKIVEEAAPAEFFDRPKTERAQRFLRTFTFDAVK